MGEAMFEGHVEATILGSGPPLVLMHSLLADRSSFHLVLEPLAAGFRVMLPALPGFGRSAPAGSSIVAVADRMALAVRDFAGGVPVRLLGNGYGGFVALQMVIRHPDLADRLVLADAGAVFSEPGREAFRAMARGAAAGGLAAIADIAMRRLFAADFHAANPELVAERRALFLTVDPAVVIGACEALAVLDLGAALPEVRLPVLAIVGSEDAATPPEMSHAVVAALPNAKLKILEGCAHVPQLQVPERFLLAVRDFLAG